MRPLRFVARFPRFRLKRHTFGCEVRRCVGFRRMLTQEACQQPGHANTMPAIYRPGEHSFVRALCGFDNAGLSLPQPALEKT